MLMKDGLAIGVIRTAMPNASGLRNAAAPTSTAAMPTRLWNAATSCGIAVIWILRAVTKPMAPPTTTDARAEGWPRAARWRLAVVWVLRRGTKADAAADNDRSSDQEQVDLISYRD